MYKTLTNPKVISGIIGGVVTWILVRNVQLRSMNNQLIREVNSQTEIASIAADTVLWMNGEFQNETPISEIAEGFNERSTFLEQVYNLNR